MKTTNCFLYKLFIWYFIYICNGEFCFFTSYIKGKGLFGRKKKVEQNIDFKKKENKKGWFKR